MRASIARRDIEVGHALPPAREIAAGLEVNQHTVLHAYQLLRDEGLVDLRRGRGAVVTAAAAGIAELFAEARELAAQAARLGVSPTALAAIVAHAAASGAHQSPPAAAPPDEEVIP